MTARENMHKSPPSLAVIMTCHNRVDTTLRSLRSLTRQLKAGDAFTLSVFLVDDGSTDGTSDRVAAEFPDVRILRGTGELFWSGGMAMAQAAAERDDPDALLWLNDDVELHDGALADAIELSAQTGFTWIVVGATTSASTGTITYTGAKRISRRPGGLVPIPPGAAPLEIDTFNGNFVLVPRSAYRTVGGVDPRFVHAYGDIDYGLRAQERGVSTILMPRPVGTCEANAPELSWRHPGGSPSRRVRLLFSRKGYPPRAHFRFNIKHAGPAGVVYATMTYAKALTMIAMGR